MFLKEFFNFCIYSMLTLLLGLFTCNGHTLSNPSCLMTQWVLHFKRSAHRKTTYFFQWLSLPCIRSKIQNENNKIIVFALNEKMYQGTTKIWVLVHSDGLLFADLSFPTGQSGLKHFLISIRVKYTITMRTVLV